MMTLSYYFLSLTDSSRGIIFICSTTELHKTFILLLVMFTKKIRLLKMHLINARCGYNERISVN